MVQTVKSETISAGHKKIVFEKPRVLRRIFMSIIAHTTTDAWYETRLSFDDPGFHSYYTLAGCSKYFEVKGEGISQRDVWAYNVSTIDILYTMTEILV